MAKEKQTTEIQTLVAGVQAERPEWLEKGSAGSEEVTTADRVLPRIDVLQALSPQIKKSDPAYIEGAEQGLMYNTVTGEIYGNAVTFIPVYFRKEYVLWKLRQHGGGFLGAFSSQQKADIAHSQIENPSQAEVVETHQHFAIILTGQGPEEAVFSMAKSKIKVSRQLNSLVQLSGVDRFAKAYQLKSVEASSDKGDYWSYSAKPVGFVTQELYNSCKELYQLIKAGMADVDRTEPEHSEGQTYESAEL